jgi:hypothetical protein
MSSIRVIRYVAERTYVATAALAFTGLIAAALAFPPAARGQEAASADAADAWRRTANGWELVNRWHEQPARYSLEPAFRLDSHPATLALLQSLAVVGAFALFPPHKSLRSTVPA